jgi:hypothetical protein
MGHLHRELHRQPQASATRIILGVLSDERFETRRDGRALAVTAVPPVIARAGGRGDQSSRPARDRPRWATTFEGQRKADLGDGTFLNPILAGDHPDPTILKDGKDYYMSFSTAENYPGLLIWHSRDLVSWRPLTTALRRNIGSVWAPELVKHAGRYFLYVPTKKTSAPGSKTTNWVIWADRIEGPWSDPIDLELPDHIDRPRLGRRRHALGRRIAAAKAAWFTAADTNADGVLSATELATAKAAKANR